jgi:hypothetical protein
MQTPATGTRAKAGLRGGVRATCGWDRLYAGSRTGGVGAETITVLIEEVGPAYGSSMRCT